MTTANQLDVVMLGALTMGLAGVVFAALAVVILIRDAVSA